MLDFRDSGRLRKGGRVFRILIGPGLEKSGVGGCVCARTWRAKHEVESLRNNRGGGGERVLSGNLIISPPAPLPFSRELFFSDRLLLFNEENPVGSRSDTIVVQTLKC